MDDNLQLKIERYISNSMLSDEVELFENQINKNVELKKEVELAKELNHFLRNEQVENRSTDKEYAKKIKTYIQSKEAKTIEDKLLKVKNEYHLENTNLKKKKNYFYVVASIAAIFILLVYNLLNQNTNEKLFAKYYSVKDLPSVIKRNDSTNELVLGVIEFNKSAYNKAIKQFDKYKNNTKNLDFSVYLYEGVAYMELKQYDKAILEFDKIINSNIIDKSKGLWFKTMVYLKMNDLNNAKKIVKKINKEDYNYKKAQKLLKNIN